jgi:hypothetical protein
MKTLLRSCWGEIRFWKLKLGDTHELHREVEVPSGDILICVGDFTMADPKSAPP